MKRTAWLLLLAPMACAPAAPGLDATANLPETSPSDTTPSEPSDVAAETRPDVASDASPSTDAAGGALDVAVDVAAVVDVAADAPSEVTDCAEGSASVGGVCAVIQPPRPVAPLSVARVTSHRPTLRWELPAGVGGAAVEVCADRACATVEQRFDAEGAAARPPVALAPGFHFWRLRGRAAGRVGPEPSPVWEFFVGRRDAAVDTSWGTRLDLNGDGRADLVVGSDEGTLPGGASIRSTSIYLGPVADAATPSIRLWTGPVERVLPLADVDGDGFPDVTGVSFLLGSPSGIRSPRGGEYFVLSAGVRRLEAPGTSFGAFVPTSAGMGDFNGDGYGDAITLTGDRLAVVKLGGPMGFTPSSTLAIPVFSVATGWDVNHDGYADLVVSAREADTVGSVSVYTGGPGGVSATPLQVLRGSAALGHDFGATLINAGDLNGDGRADLAVSATLRSSTSTGDFRRVHIYLGGADRLASEPAATIVGTNAFSAFADIMAPAGDVDGDGYDDLLVRGPRGASDDGYVHLYPGGPTGLRGGGARVLSAPCEDGYFGVSLAGADLDGDGYDDVVVGQPGMSSSPGCNGGRVVVFAGGPMGVSSAPSAVLRAPENPLRPALYVRDRFGQAVGGLQ